LETNIDQIHHRDVCNNQKCNKNRMRSNQQPLVDNLHVRQGNNSVSIGLRYIEEVTRKLDQEKNNLCV
jgi:hypothetical protein